MTDNPATDSHTDESGFDSNVALDYSGILITAVVGAVATYSLADSPVFIYVAALSAIQFLLFMVFLRTEQRHQMLRLFWLEAVCITLLIFLVPSSFIVILTMVWLVQSVELFGLKKSIPYVPVSLAIFTAAQLMHFGVENWPGTFISVALYGLLQIFAIFSVQRAISERKQREHTAALNRELIATRELLSQSSAQGERLRIARDLHDILGHHMTALILNLEIASHSVEGEPKTKVEQSLALAKLLLSDLRSTVSELREESPLNLEESLNKLVAGIPNFAIDVDFSEAPQIEDLDVAETLLRCAQEGVTNVLRHSDANHCRIVVTGSPENVTLSVIDNGSSNSNIEPGNGLKGMIERVQARGGELGWQQDAEGFRLNVTLGVSPA
jgi:two-component system sensor histidine kinase DesK